MTTMNDLIKYLAFLALCAAVAVAMCEFTGPTDMERHESLSCSLSCELCQNEPERLETKKIAMLLNCS